MYTDALIRAITVIIQKSIANFSVVFNPKGRALLTFVYISLEAEELLF